MRAVDVHDSFAGTGHGLKEMQVGWLEVIRASEVLDEVFEHSHALIDVDISSPDKGRLRLIEIHVLVDSLAVIRSG